MKYFLLIILLISKILLAKEMYLFLEEKQAYYKEAQAKLDYVPLPVKKEIKNEITKTYYKIIVPYIEQKIKIEVNNKTNKLKKFLLSKMQKIETENKKLLSNYNYLLKKFLETGIITQKIIKKLLLKEVNEIKQQRYKNIDNIIKKENLENSINYDTKKMNLKNLLDIKQYNDIFKE